MRRTSRPRRAAVRRHTTARRPVARRRALIRMRARRAHGWLRARSRQPRTCGTLSASWRRREHEGVERAGEAGGDREARPTIVQPIAHSLTAQHNAHFSIHFSAQWSNVGRDCLVCILHSTTCALVPCGGRGRARLCGSAVSLTSVVWVARRVVRLHTAVTLSLIHI
eukprot:420359-Prymnesium_polylepis.1